MTDVATARARIGRLQDKMARYPEHEQKALMLSEVARYEAIVKAAFEDGPPPNKLQARVDALAAGIRKIDAVLEAEPKHPNKARFLERRAEYLQSVANIRDFGREKMSIRPVGAKIEVPADIIKAGAN